MSTDKTLSADHFTRSVCNWFEHSNINSIGKIVDATIVDIDRKKGIVTVDAGLKAICPIPMREFFIPGEKEALNIGDKIKVYVNGLDARGGKPIVSRDRATQEESWLKVKQAFEDSSYLDAIPIGKIKGGLSVDFEGFIGFLPGSHIGNDQYHVSDATRILGKKCKVKVVSIDDEAKTAVFSIKEVENDAYSGVREEFFANTKEGDTISGKVRNITDYGVFVDINCGIDALLPLQDISWQKINHPSELLNVGDKIECKVMKCEKETGRIALSMKHLTENPWVKLVKDLEIGQTISGQVTNIVDYGLFVAISEGVEGLVHLSEITWGRDSNKKHKEYKIGDKIEAIIIELDIDRQRIGLSIKRLSHNPWKEFIESHQEGYIMEGPISRITEYGFFVTIENEIDGLVHVDDLTWSPDRMSALHSYKIGDVVKVMYLGADEKFTKIKLGVKQTVENPFEKYKDTLKIGSVVTCTVTGIKPERILVEVHGISSSIRKQDLSRERREQRTERFTVGDKIDAKITAHNRETGAFSLSVAALEEEEYGKILEKYGSSETGASIADILGIAIENAKKSGE